MKPEQITWLSQLDPNKENGTIQSVLLRNDLSSCPFEGTLKFLLQATLDERKQLLQENKRYADILKKNGLYTHETIYPEL